MRMIVSVAIVALFSSAATGWATTCTGKFNTGTSTIVEFKSQEKAKYCYGDECWTQKIFKNGKDYLFLVGGNTAASVELKASGKGFNAKWRFGNISATAKLTCK